MDQMDFVGMPKGNILGTQIVWIAELVIADEIAQPRDIDGGIGTGFF
jgi:hypothetical protein